MDRLRPPYNVSAAAVVAALATLEDMSWVQATIDRIVAERERKGRPISFNDAWIAACAVKHGVPLVTHNPKDFEQISGLNIVSEANQGRS